MRRCSLETGYPCGTHRALQEFDNALRPKRVSHDATHLTTLRIWASEQSMTQLILASCREPYGGILGGEMAAKSGQGAANDTLRRLVEADNHPGFSLEKEALRCVTIVCTMSRPGLPGSSKSWWRQSPPIPSRAHLRRPARRILPRACC